MESSPHGAGFRQAAEEGAPLSPTSSPRHRQSEVALSTKEKDGCHIPVKVRFGLHRPHYSITMPERVLAVACMLKTLNSEASVHVLSSSSGSPSSSHKRFTCGKPSRSGFHPKPTLLAEEEKQSAGVGRRTNSQGHPSGGGGRKGRAKQEKSLDRHTSPPAQSFPTPCALEEAVNRWNAFQSKKIAAESLSSRKEKKKLKDPHDEQIGEQEEDVPLTMRGLRLTHVYHPTELAEKAPSELQLPSSSMQ